MAIKTKIREVTITASGGAFSLFRKSKEKYDFSGIEVVRQVLSNEKAKILHVIKTQKPKSIYELAKNLGRSFQPVNEDIKILQRLGFIELIEEKTKNRLRYRPAIVVDNIIINIKV